MPVPAIDDHSYGSHRATEIGFAAANYMRQGDRALRSLVMVEQPEAVALRANEPRDKPSHRVPLRRALLPKQVREMTAR